MFERFRPSTGPKPNAAASLRKAFQDASSAAHLAIHMQELYCNLQITTMIHRLSSHMAYGLKDLVGKVDSFADDMRDALGLNIWVKHMTVLKELENFKGDLRDRFIRSSQTLSGKLKPASDKIIEEPCQNAMESIELRNALSDKDIRSLLITGVMYDKCVTETAIGAKRWFNAAGRESEIFIVRDLTTADLSCRYLPDPEAGKRLRAVGIHEVTRAEVEEVLGLRSAGPAQPSARYSGEDRQLAAS